MAFSGAYISHIKKITHGKSNLATAHQQQLGETSLNNDDISNSDDSRPTADDDNKSSNEYTEANYPGVLDTELTALTTAQRNIFIVTLTILCLLSLCGNMCTLFVNFRRKIRPFFRACLISLAFSDLMNTVFLTTAYLSQFTAEYVQIWRLGDLMCSFVPFATTSAILASSMTLVGIAVDRYFAVMKAVIGFWNPTVISCIVCMLCIWLASIGIACPVFTIYDLIPVYILTEEHETMNTTGWSTTTETEAVATNATTISSLLATENGLVIMMPKKPNITVTTNMQKTQTQTTTLLAAVTATGTKSPWEIEAALEDLSYTLVREQKLVNMCVSDQNNVALYYAIVFVIIFIPCIGAFFWFNSIIARKLWKRRHIAAITKRRTLRGKTKNQIPCTNETPKTQQPKCSFLSTKNRNCKSGHTSSSTLPSSLTNTMGGKMTTATDASATTNNTSNVSANNSREARHLRMFTIILLMMAVFVFLRLPAWIFLLMRMYGSYTKPTHWILYFVFGLMNLASSVLNPLFYTFLTETIQYTLIFKAKVSSLLCCCYSQLCCCCYRVKYGSHKETTSSAVFPPNPNECHSTINMENVKEPWHAKIHCCEYLCGCSGFLRASLSCYQPHLKTEHKYKVHTHSVPYENENRSKEESEGGQATNNDKDEGVDCSDEIDDEDVRDFYEYNQKIYTIFPPSLVSSSINSQMS
ncbi:hypothetical protein FF38_11421 [Lucilia cuprina]|uniref:G-protein coupled receptors family 1 profile domain-containing protein n=1 Tax=Lucilia cuprina TaxID=7375 RepID=A0A0L0CBT9_LUCCU|nr:hypothetical protein FF38_11421 [Lucilia cuprina]